MGIRVVEELVSERPGTVVAAFIAVAALFGAAATQITIDTSIENLMIEGDPRRERNRELQREFSNDAVIIVAFDLGRPFTAQDLEKLRNISNQISAIDGVDEVVDLSNVADVRGSEEGLDASPLVDFTVLDEDLDRIHQRVRGHRLYDEILVSESLDVLAIIVYVEPDLEPMAAHRVTRAILGLLDEGAAPFTAYVSGYAPAEWEGHRIAQHDLSMLTGAALLCVLIVVYWATRRAAALLLLLVLIGWAELVTIGWMALTNTPLSVVTATIPSLTLTISATYAIYFLGALQRASQTSEPGVAAMRLLSRPVLLSGLSTGIGFLSLQTIEVQVIGDLGVALAVTCVACVCGTLLLLPALVQRFQQRLPMVELSAFGGLSMWGVHLARRPWLPVGVAFVMGTLAIAGTGRLFVDTNIMDYFRPTNHLRASSMFIRDELAGPFVNRIVVRTQVENGALEPEVVAFTHDLIEYIEENPIVDRVISFLDYLALVDEALRPGEEARRVLPTRGLAVQYMLLYAAGGDSNDYRHFINHDRSALSVTLLSNAGSADVIKLSRDIDEYATRAPTGVEVEIISTGYLFQDAMEGLVRGMLRGIATALALICMVLFVILRSVKLTLVAAIPNIFPVIVCAGTLGWLGIPLSIGTSVLGCIALGLAVDDTAHVLGHLDPNRSIEDTYQFVGRPVILTTVALGLGFSVLLFSDFLPVVVLGAATALTLVVALLADLLLLPSLLVLIGYQRLSGS